MLIVLAIVLAISGTEYIGHILRVIKELLRFSEEETANVCEESALFFQINVGFLVFCQRSEQINFIQMCHILIILH